MCLSQFRDPRDTAVDYRQWIEWKSNGRFLGRVTAPDNIWTDLSRYLALESEAKDRDADREKLLRRIDRHLAEMSGTYRWTLLSLKADLFARNGRRAAALALARQPFLEMKPQLTRDPAARVHFELVATRYARIARDAGESANADAALRDVKELSARRTLS